MSAAEIAEAGLLSERRSEAQIVRLAAACLRKSRQIGIWFGASCLAPVAVLAAPAVRPALIGANVWLWLAALLAAVLLPIPVMAAARKCAREGNVIAYAYWLKKDPSRLTRD
jgi:hypothetical protein